MRENELYRALDASVTACQPSDYWKNRMVRQIVKGEEMKKRTKLSVGAILVAALLLISAAALAVSALINEYYAKVAQMEREGAMERWQLEDKLAFVNNMKEYDFALDEELYAQAVDETLPAEQREAAADRIINNTYGEMIRGSLMYYTTVEDDSLGMAPDIRDVFDERYFAEHPDWEETDEGMQAYFDAVGHFLRDEIGREKYTNTVTEKPVVDEAYAVKALRDEMKDSLGWDPEAVDAMEPEVVWDEECRQWYVRGEVSRESMEKATDRRRGMNPVLYTSNVWETADGWDCFIMVDEKGHIWTENESRWDFIRAYQDKTDPVEKISMKRALELAEAAVKEKYRPDEAEWHEVFADAEDIGTGEEDGLLYRFDFHRHYFYYGDKDLLWGAVVNMATGKAETVLSYRAEDRAPVWQLLEYAAKTEQAEGWYSVWKPESRQDLAELIRACGLLPEDRQLPAEETDALAAEAFGAQGHLSLLNVRAMMHALLGQEDAWSLETKVLADRLAGRYMISGEDLLAEQRTEQADISADEAARIIKAAVCEAWEMPADALDKWTVVTRKAEDRVTEDISRPDPTRVNMVYYRVFLTRPDEEVGLDTFGGLDNMNYRLALDGTVLTTEQHKGWYSPKEDRERWRK